MPIRINLLAEAQAAEDIRRRDPVKRTIWAAVFIVILVLVWSSSLQVKVMTENSRLSSLEGKLSSRTNEYQLIISNKKKLDEANDKIAALNRLAANRFLYATLLDAIQHTTVEGIQLSRLKIEHNFDLTAEVKPTKSDDKVIPGKPATSTEKVILILDAKDSSHNPGGDQVNRFKDAIAQSAYFKTNRIGTNGILLKNLSAPQLDGELGKQAVQFTFDCRFPEKVR
ncbi:MAG: hypothetical protein JWQ71_1702 [Pedosphaera sp.]|nr:hypothetical protein [Pedosphaera sp.]